MKIKFASLISGAAMAASVMIAPKVSAFDIGVGVGVENRPPVVVQPAPVMTRRWVPDHVIRREERVLVQPQRAERREQQVLVEPAHMIKKEERVLVHAERVEKRSEQILVKPATVVREWVPPVQEQVKIGPVFVARTVREGFYRDVTVPPVYETIVREIRIPAKYDVVVREVECPAKYETRYVEFNAPPKYEMVFKDVVVPGHWEESAVVPPPVVVAPRERSGFELDLEFNKRRKD